MTQAAPLPGTSLIESTLGFSPTRRSWQSDGGSPLSPELSDLCERSPRNDRGGAEVRGGAC